MAEESSLIKVFDGDKLIGLENGCNLASQQPLTLFEAEVLRIFGEYTQLQTRIELLDAENKRLKAKLARTELQELKSETYSKLWENNENESYEQCKERLERIIDEFNKKAKAITPPA